MPIKIVQFDTLGNSRSLARKYLRQTVKGLENNLDIKQLYWEFLNEH